MISRDQFGRTIEYLRISVTDRCNFRCLYCMPERGMTWLPRPDLLTYEEIAEVVRQLAPLGLRRIRLTGGEPTIRPQLETLIGMLAGIDGIDDLAMTTNGVVLAARAEGFRAAGLHRVNVSVDSLRPDRIARIARRDLGFDPLATLAAAEAAGLVPVKINTVVMRGINDEEIEDLARLTLEHPWHVRFIELMPVGELRDLTWEHVVPSDEVLGRVARLGALDVPAVAPRGNGPARVLALPNARGTVGVITPLSHTFCASCNRVRLTADGRLRTCLFGDHEVNLRDALRAGEPLAPLFQAALAAKPREHALLQMRVGGLRALSEVGG